MPSKSSASLGAQRAAIGFRAHSGWAAMVVVASPARSPTVIDRRRIDLVDHDDQEAKQPFHAAAEMKLRDGEKLIRRHTEAARTSARNMLRETAERLRRDGFEVAGCGVVLGSRRQMPDLSKTLKSHAMIHAAEGDLFRQVLVRGAEDCGLAVTGVGEKELFDQASKRLRLDAPAVHAHLADIGKAVGRPWRQDEKYATLAGWLALIA
jgi:hypothetical protein